jgi:MATE family multidrug resistance protein
MRSSLFHEVLSEVRPTLRLAGPVILGQIGIMSMNLVDTVMVGQLLGKHAVAAVGIGGSAYSAVFMAGFGLLLGLDRVVSVAYGAGRRDECQRAMWHGLFLALCIGIPLTAGLMVASQHLNRSGIVPELLPPATAYLQVLAWSLLPTLLFTVLRSTLQAMDDVRVASMLLLAANVLNAAANWLFIRGGLGVPPLGIVGSAWATLLSRVVMLIALAAYVRWRGVGPSRVSWRPDPAMLRDLLRLGIPSSIQVSLEVGVFTLATFLAAGLDATASAAHNIVLLIASFTFMVPLGMSSAGAVRVGHALGRGEPEGARRAGWCAVALGVGFMALSALVLVTCSTPILRLFTQDGPTIALAARLMLCAAIFQLFDGAQVTLSGVLRGLGYTTSSMVANAIGHWGLGLPVGWWLAMRGHFGVVGLWLGLATGLAAVACMLTLIWQRGIARLVAGHGAAAAAA